MTTDTRVNSYRIRSFSPGSLEAIESQLQLASRYRAALVRLEIERRRRIAEAEGTHILGLREARQAEAMALDKFTEHVDSDVDPETRKLVREERHTQLVAATKLRRQLEKEAVNVQRKQARGYRLRKLWRLLAIGSSGPRTKERVNAKLSEDMLLEPGHELWKDVRRAEDWYVAEIKRARSENGLTAGTGWLVDEEVDGAKRDPGAFGKHKAADSVGIQVARGMPLADLHAPGGRAHLELPPGNWKTRASRSVSLTPWRLQLGTDPRIEVDGICNMYRAIPADAEIRKVVIVRDKRHGRTRYDLQFTYRSSMPQGTRKRPGVGVAAVDIAWEERGDDVRVARVYTEHGHSEELVLRRICKHERRGDAFKRALDLTLPKGHVLLLELAEQSAATVHQWRDGERVTVPARDAVGEALDRPGLLLECCRAIVGANDCSRFYAEIWQRWKQARIPQKLDLFCEQDEFFQWLGERDARMWLMIYHEKIRHLARALGSIRAANARRRDDAFKQWAARLRAEYGSLVVDGRSLARYAQSERGTRANSTRHKSAPGMFRLALKEVFRGDLIAIDAGREDDLLSAYHKGVAKVGKAKGKQRKRSRGIQLKPPLATSL